MNKKDILEEKGMWSYNLETANRALWQQEAELIKLRAHLKLAAAVCEEAIKYQKKKWSFPDMILSGDSFNGVLKAYREFK